VAVLAERRIVVADKVSVVEHFPQSWTRECFQGPRGRGAQAHRVPATVDAPPERT
jgi:phospholipid/cholesterol/gamma-HCH transport system ATP-binding protein